MHGNSTQQWGHTDSQALARAKALYEQAHSEAGHSKAHVDIVRTWQDGPLLFVHACRSLSGGEPLQVATDFFVTDHQAQLIEHHSVVGEFKSPNPSGRNQVDGATEIVDLERTDENKAVVKAMLENCLFPGAQPERIEEYFAEDYRQHNPNVGDGLAIVRKLAQAENPSLIYTKIVLLVGKGNFVAALCNASWEGAPLRQVDILRLEDGKIVEHWDNTAPALETTSSQGV